MKQHNGCAEIQRRRQRMKTMALVAGVISCSILICRADDSSGKLRGDVLPQTTNGNFVLYVSNQSPDISPVDITIHIDGKKAVSADFTVGNAHGWVKHTFQLASGKHQLVVGTQKGSAQMEKDIEIKDKHWAVIDYWFSKQEMEKKFTFKFQDTPIMFM